MMAMPMVAICAMTRQKLAGSDIGCGLRAPNWKERAFQLHDEGFGAMVTS
jgi:hypothetical protein